MERNNKLLILVIGILVAWNYLGGVRELNSKKDTEVIVVTLTDFESDNIAEVTEDLVRLQKALAKERNGENRREVVNALNKEITRGEEHLQSIVNESIEDANDDLAAGGSEVIENINEFIDGSDYLSGAKDYITSIDGETVDGWIDSLRDIVRQGNDKLQEIYEENVGGNN